LDYSIIFDIFKRKNNPLFLVVRKIIDNKAIILDLNPLDAFKGL